VGATLIVGSIGRLRGIVAWITFGVIGDAGGALHRMARYGKARVVTERGRVERLSPVFAFPAGCLPQTVYGVEV
jgi:hypothetical protein